MAPREGLATRGKVLLVGVLLLAMLGALVGVFIWLRGAVYYPDTIVSGENTCWVGRYDLSEDGFAPLQKIIDRSQDMSQNVDVAAFEARVDGEGYVISLSLSLDAFDETGVFLGRANYEYYDRKLFYSPPTLENPDLIRQENPNSRLEYLDGLIKTIPLREQIGKSGLEQYAIRYQPHTMVGKDIPIFDGRSGAAFEALSPEEYNAGVGGFSDGKTNVAFLLYDGEADVTLLLYDRGRMASEQTYWYVFEPADPALAVGNPDVYEECDYSIGSDYLRLMRNYGQDVINTDLTADELSETLDFYRNSPYPTPESLFLSPDATLPIAFFYGGNPVLKISADNGATWNTVPFPRAKDFGRSITKRAVGFVTPQFGYVALGTDWSMGGGEHKRCYFTSDGGISWTDKTLPLAGTSSTLIDIAMADEKNGVVALNEGVVSYLPLLYATTDTGDTWEQISLPYYALPREIQYFSTIDSLIYEDGKFVLTLSQGDSGTFKAIFTTIALDKPWEFVEAH
ncbi:MAG: hypothetical protein LBC23_01005 [Coriobacteriales bacterium]|jgi:hypothetical protein|nr:hypothetical protein [Coriobacteriales bacterium]